MFFTKSKEKKLTGSKEEKERARMVAEVGKKMEACKARFPIGSIVSILGTDMIVVGMFSDWPDGGIQIMVKYLNNSGELICSSVPVESLLRCSRTG